MFAGSPFAGADFAQAIISFVRRRVGGIGGSGMSDEEYERLLHRLGATTAADEREEETLVALRMFGLV